MKKPIILFLLVLISFLAKGQKIIAAKGLGGVGCQDWFSRFSYSDNGDMFLYVDMDYLRFLKGITFIKTDTLPIHDCLLFRYDKDMNLKWQKIIRTTANSYTEFSCFKTDQKGNLIMVYNLADSLNFDNNIFDSTAGKTLIMKIDTSGKIVSHKQFKCQFGGLKEITIGNDGSVYGMGSLGNFPNNKPPYITFGSLTLHLPTNPYVSSASYVVKLDPNLNGVWGHTILNSDGASENDFQFSDLAVDNIGNVSLSGRILEYQGWKLDSFYSGQFLPFKDVNKGRNQYYNTTLQINNFFIIKFNSKGGLSWAKNYGENSELNSFKVDSTGNYYATGFLGTISPAYKYSIISNDTLWAKGTDQDILVAKFDSSGNLKWAHNIGGDVNCGPYGCGGLGTEYGKSIVLDQFGSLYVGGRFRGRNLYFDNTKLGYYKDTIFNILIAKMDTKSGKLIWYKYIDGLTFSNIYVRPEGECLVSGMFGFGTYDFDSIPLTSYSHTEYFTVQLQNNIVKANGIENAKESDREKDLVYPNPVSEILNVKVQDQTRVTITLFNTNGQMIFSRVSMESGIIQIPVSYLPKGIYFLRMESSNKVSYGKVVVE